MSLPIEEVAETWKSLTGKRLDDAELTKLAEQLESWADMTAKVFLETDFLDRYPHACKILRGLAPTIRRCLLESPDQVLEKIKAKQIAVNRAELFEKQREYAEKTTELVDLELQILTLKRVLGH